MDPKCRVFAHSLVLMCGVALLPDEASAQSTAQPVTPGYLSTSNCPSVNLTPCFIPYGSSIPVSPGSSLTLTDRSITTSTTSQTLAAANTSRKSLSIQNTSTTVNVCYTFAAPAVCGATGSYTLYSAQTAFWPAGSAPSSTVSIIAASGTPIVSAYEAQ